MLPTFAALHVTSNFTFLTGASHPEELVAEAARLGYAAITLTDEATVAGIVRAHVAAKAHKIKLLVGAAFLIDDAPALNKIILIAQSREGYGNLCELITLTRRRAQKGRYALCLADLAILHCIAIAVPATPFADAAPTLTQLKENFPGRLWLGVARQFGSDDANDFETLAALARATALPQVALPPITMHARQRKPLQDTLAAIRLKTTLDHLGHAVPAHAEAYLKPITQFTREYPLTMLIETKRIAALCDFSLDELRYEYPREVVPANETPADYLRRLTYQGLSQRYGATHPPKVVAQVEHELSLISELKYEAYFLTIHDIVQFARTRGILCQGRGSAANSAVCYCLGITEVDPSRMELLFERFISRERNEPPDIDVDFEHERREEVIQYLYTKYGRERVAITAAISTYRPKGAIRDVGKALGLSLDQVDSLARSINWWDGRTIAPERLIEAGFDPDHPHMQMVLSLTHQLVGFPRHLSQHSGGFVIARDKLTRLVPVENAAMADRTVIEWDKDDLDELGLLKVDILALGMLTAISKTIALLNHYHGVKLAMQDIPAEDPATYQMMQKADTIGVFQIESRAQMSMLPRLKPANFYDLVIEVAIVRPGPIQGGMVHPYLRRRNGEEPVTYPSRDVEDVLKRTLGVSIFQEQVMKLAVIAAGFTPGEADRLRRAMAAWKRKGGIEPFREQLMGGMQARGYSHAYAEQIYKQMQGFGEYGFPESHAASFALLVYVSAWLKCHHPAAFTCALLNSQPLGFYSPSALTQDAKRHGVIVLPPDVMVSDWDAALEGVHHGVKSERGTSPFSKGRLKEIFGACDTLTTPNPALRLGLRLISHFSAAAAARLMAARDDAPFSDLADLKRRAQLDEGDIAALAAADAFATLAGHRREALWAALGTTRDAALFHAPLDDTHAALSAPTEAANVLSDYQTTGLTLRTHPIALLRAKLDKSSRWSAEKIRQARAGQLVRIAGLVTCRQRPSTASGTTFVTLEDETGDTNIIVWPRVAEAQRQALVFSRLMEVAGHVERQGEVVHVIAGHLMDKTYLLGALAVASREFH